MFRVEAEVSALKKLCASISPVVSRSTIPVLSMARFRANLGTLSGAVTNLDQSMTATCACTGDGEALIHIPKLGAFLSALPSGATVCLVENVSGIVATSDAAKFNIATLPVSDFPSVVCDAVSDGDTLELDGGVLSSIVATLLPACEHGTITRAYTHGIWFQDGRLVASEGKILGQVPFEALAGLHKEFLFPTESLLLCKSMLTGTVKIRVSKDGSALTVENETGSIFRTKLVETRAPPFDRIITTPDKWLKADADALLCALSQGAVCYFSDKPATSRIGIDISATRLTFCAEWNNEKSSGECGIDYDGGPDNISSAAVHSFLRWALESLDCDTVEIGFSNQNPSIHFRSVAGDPKNLRIVMAMK